ncbi:MAG TPA: ribonuclease H-like YkuK family protein [bacterium]|nr:ribonuclease H-like YkuK family protein [bacterium]
MDTHAMPQPIDAPGDHADPAPSPRPVKPARGTLEFISPTSGKVSFRQMFEQIVAYMSEEPDQAYHLIIGTDSLLSDQTCFVTAVIIHRLGHGGRYFYRKMYNRKMDSLRQRIFFETALSLETAGLLSAELSRNGHSELPVEIHLDVGPNGDTKRVIREVVGMVTGSGYLAVTKPDAYGATKVADKHSK